MAKTQLDNDSLALTNVTVTAPDSGARTQLAKFTHIGQKSLTIVGEWGAADVGTSNGILLDPSGGALGVGSSGSAAKFLVDSNGSVGVNCVPNSTYKLDVNGYARFGGTGTGFDVIDLPSTNSVALRMQAQGNSSIASVGTTSNHPLCFFTNNTERVRIDTSGNLLVGRLAAIMATTDTGTFERNQNDLNRVVINNQSNGAAAGVQLDLEAYGGAWRLFVPSSATNTNPLIFTSSHAPVGEKARFDNNGNFGIGHNAPKGNLHVSKAGEPTVYITNHQSAATANAKGGSIIFQSAYTLTGTYYDNARIDAITAASSLDVAQMVFSTGRGGQGNVEAMRIDANGNLLVGATSGTCHRIVRTVTTDAGNQIAAIESSQGTAYFYAVAGGGIGNAANAAMKLNKDATTGRSINAQGTVNASGADYAEYMTKEEGCDAIEPGETCGVNADGKLTKIFARAVSFMIKSTNPSYVGGDTWGTEEALGVIRPVEPVLELPPYAGATHPGEAPVAPIEPGLVNPIAPVEPTAPASDADEEAKTDYQLAMGNYQRDLARYEADLAACGEAQAAYEAALTEFHDADTAYEAALGQFEHDQQAYADQVASAREQFESVTYPAYQAALADFDARLEAARQKVDRIAFCGQVPVNVTGAAPGQYLVPAESAGGGIAVQLVDPDAITFEQYRRAVGIVQNILPEGRANVRVKPV